MANTHPLFELAENEVVFAVKKNEQVNDGWLVFSKTTGAAVAHISEDGVRTDFNT